MMRNILIFSIVFLACSALASAQFIHIPRPIGSGVLNERLTGEAFGWNPYYARSTAATHRELDRPNSHIYISDALAEQVYQNPQLLKPIASTNFDRNLKAFGPTHISYPTRDIAAGYKRGRIHFPTGRIRTSTFSAINHPVAPPRYRGTFTS